MWVLRRFLFFQLCVFCCIVSVAECMLKAYVEHRAYAIIDEQQLNAVFYLHKHSKARPITCSLRFTFIVFFRLCLRNNNRSHKISVCAFV